MSRPFKVAIFTGTRADYGILRPVIQALSESSNFVVDVIPAASHFSTAAGGTLSEIIADGVVPFANIECLLVGDSPLSTSLSTSLCTSGLAYHFSHNRPDLLIVLGDRTEVLAAATTATIFNIPIAHIHGGEVTTGAIDDVIRHAVTKLSHMHFVATSSARQRVLQMGENPDNVVLVGAPGLQNVKDYLIGKLRGNFSVPLEWSKGFFLVTIHPETRRTSSLLVDSVLSALGDFLDIGILFTGTNSDTGSQAIRKKIERFCESHSNAILVPSLGTANYFKAVESAICVIGNSSSGLIEVPSLNTPTINVGSRQDGRDRGPSVIDVPVDKEHLLAAMKDVLTGKHCGEYANPYDYGNAPALICEALLHFLPQISTDKRFYSVSYGYTEV
jgi:UDP-hydrolysing UDP-N-acetyl-D-glucosamine 2-epimerase